ncbi:MAG: phosphoribosylglycinamide formyltransferase [Pseudothermotoga sp.]
MKTIRVGILASGNGSNFQAIVDRSERGTLPAKVAVLVSDKSNAFVLQRAKNHGIPAYVIKPKEFSDQHEYEQKMIEILNQHGVELVVLAGFMRILSSKFIQAFKNRIINIHPSLIPAFCGKGFYGMTVHQAVFEYGVKITGATVHFVNEDIDAGPIIIQKPVFVCDEDTPETIAEKVHQVEHEILPEAIRLFALGKLQISGRRVIVKE